ncbi:MAG: cytochrome c oxidase accessory protein CcoG [Spirochaetota bacterium]
MVISRHITGKVRNARYVVETILATIYFGIPWLHFQGKPLMRLDIPNRQFHLLGNIYIPQEGIYLHLFLGVMGLSLFFFTALIGRVWCGWACPQTVFTDFFDLWGRLILGKKYGKKDAPKGRKLLLHFFWIVFSFIASFHFVAYFKDPVAMIGELASLQFVADSSYTYFLAFFTGLLYVDMTLVREQFCKYACPYARFQTVLMDEHSYNVTYDYKRGEPRRNKKVKIGDCTAYNMCLVVCPTGIDIRDGLNVGCIACGKCVDACTIQMNKENKKTLIGYNSLGKVETGKKIKWVRPRTLIYGSLWCMILVVAVVLLYNRVPLYIRAIPDRTIAPMLIPGEQIRNFYNLRIINISYEQQDLQLRLDKGDYKGNVKLRVGGKGSLVSVAKNSEEKIRIIVEADNVAKNRQQKTNYPIELIITDKNNTEIRKTAVLPLILVKGSG